MAIAGSLYPGVFRVLAGCQTHWGCFINHTELKLLRILFRYNNCRLTNLAAKMNMTKASVQRDAETYLQQKNLIGIDTQGRFLTKEGRELVLNINESRTV